ncbi:MAG: L-serine ammonia-lyase, iron-sulfur-dependent, subunit alpha, partial [Clostridia bacterium]|nr:L-serine ammonia-lyase, iron-sulfur-dependent, subunit alpha [Clostridia bacterium]
MKSVRNLYKIGIGPSSSHTMGPAFAAEKMLLTYPCSDRFEVILYGSLAKTGRGHGTDRAISDILTPIETEIIFDMETEILPHPNTLKISAFKDGELIGQRTFMSIGGGEIRIEGDESAVPREVYTEQSFTEIMDYCAHRNIRLSDYVFMHEDEDFKDYLSEVWHTMTDAIRQGLTHTGELPGGLGVKRKAQKLHSQRHIDESPQTKENRLVCSYAFAVSEQNADCGLIVTAPTCGACG